MSMTATPIIQEPLTYDCGGGWIITERTHPSGFKSWLAIRVEDFTAGNFDLCWAGKNLAEAFNFVAGVRGLRP